MANQKTHNLGSTTDHGPGTASTILGTNVGGTNIVELGYSDLTTVAGNVPVRIAFGDLLVPLTPSIAAAAASKSYVDSVSGGSLQASYDGGATIVGATPLDIDLTASITIDSTGTINIGDTSATSVVIGNAGSTITLGDKIEFVSGGPTQQAGSATPEAAVTADVGSLFMRTDGGTATSLYIKESGVGNTGWVAVGGSVSPLTTKGDLWVFTTVDDRLGVGADGQVLQADSAAGPGVSWFTLPTGGDHTVSSGNDRGNVYTAVTLFRESTNVINGLQDGAGVRQDWDLEDFNDNQFEAGHIRCVLVSGSGGGGQDTSYTFSTKQAGTDGDRFKIDSNSETVEAYYKFVADLTNADTAISTVVSEIRRGSSGLAAVGLGGELRWVLQDAAGTDEDAGGITYAWVTATNGSEEAKVVQTIAVNSVLETALTLDQANSLHRTTIAGQLLITDTDVSPVADRQLAVIDGIIEAQTNAAVEGRYISKDSIEQLAIADLSDGGGITLDADWNAQTILRATVDDTPTALTVGEQTLVGRITAGNIEALTATQVRTLLNVEDGAAADQTGAEIKSAYEGEADTNAFTDANVITLSTALVDDDFSAGEGFLRKTGATNAYEAIKSNIGATVAPTINEDSGDGYAVGSIWIDTTGNEAWSCVDATVGAAVWLQTGITTGGVDAAGAVMETDYVGAQSVLAAITASTPVNIVIAENELLGRALGGSVTGLVQAQILGIIGVEAGATADQTAGEIKTAYESNANTNPFTDGNLSSLNAALVDGNFGGTYRAHLIRITGTTYAAIKQALTTGTPTVNDDSVADYNVGSVWYDQTGDKVYVCIDSTFGAAVWVETTQQVDATSVNAAGAVMEADFIGMQSVLGTTTVVGTPGNIALGNGAMLGRPIGGNLQSMFPTAIRTLINVQDGATADNNPILDQDFTLPTGVMMKTLAGSYRIVKTQDNATVDPDADNDSTEDYAVGSKWNNVTGDTVWVCIDASAAAAVWFDTTQQVTATTVGAAGAVMDSDISPAEGFLRKTGAGAYTAIKSNIGATVAPTINEDSGDGYGIGSVWLDTTADKAYVALDVTVAAAVWIETTAGATVAAHAASHTDGSDDIQSATAGQKGLATATQITKLDGIEALADVTDATNVDSAGAVMEVDFNAQTILRATVDDTPTALTVGTQTLVGRITAGNIEALSVGQVQTLLNVADGANAYVHPNHSGDVTSVADGAQTIAVAAVTLAKMADMATASFIGRDTAASGVPEILSKATALSILNVADGANLYVHPNHSGDVTSIADGATTIAVAAVTLAKMADMATASFIGRDTAASGVPEILSKTTALSILNVEDGADVTDATNVNAAGAVMEADFNAQTILRATADDTPTALTVGVQTLVGRITAGNIEALSVAQVQTLLNVADGANLYVHPNHSGDVTSVADGAQTIAVAAVTLAKMADMATASFIGRDTAASGVPEILSKTTALSILNVEDGADVTDLTNVAAAGAVMDSDISAAEGFLRKTGAGAYEAIKSNIGAAVAPTANEDSGDGYAVGSIWLNTTADTSYVLIDSTVASAVWLETGSTAGLVSHAASHTDGSDDIQDATAAQKGLATSTQITKLDGIEALADVTDATNVDSAGAVMEADFNAQTILRATVDDTPTALTVGTQTLVGRITAGNIEALSVGQVQTLLNVADGANLYVHPNHSGDVTSVADGAQTIAVAAVTLAKMADMATASLLGRNTVGTGVPEVLSKATALSLLNVADGANLYVHPNHSGDVTSVADGATTIATSAVTLAKMADIATASFLGRNTAATGIVEVLSKATALSILNVADGANAYVHPNHSGDVTSVADGATTIVAEAVTLAKMANMATASLLGRDTAGTGVPEVLSKATALSLLNVADGANLYVHPNHSGDVTSVADGATTIVASAVTLAKMADIATASFLGRDTAATGIVEVLSKATALSILNVEDGADVTDLTNVAAAGAVMDSDISAAEGFLRKTGAGAYEAIKSNIGAAVAPTANEDSGDGYAVGSIWLDTTADKSYVLVDATVAAAVWLETGTTAGLVAHAASHTDGSDDIQNATAAQKGLATSTQITKLDGIEALADVTDATNVDSAGAVMESDYNAQTILQATTNDTPTALTVGEQTLVGRITSGNITALTTTQIRTLINVEDGADVTDATNVDSAGAVMEVDFNAQTILRATADDTPTALTVGVQTLVGRITAGNIEALTVGQVQTLLNVADGANAYTHPNHTGDVTSVADGAQTIVAEAVTLAKMANMATASFIGRDTAATGVPEILSKATALSILNVEDGADVTDATNVDSAGAVMEADFNAQTILRATADDTPTALTVGIQTLVGRITAGNIEALSVGQVQTLLNVADGANLYVHPNHSGDVTSVADGAQTIAASAVTLAKMADITTASFLGRNTAATGIVEVLSKTTALSILNVEDGADITDATNVNAAGAVMEADFNAQTILRATADDTPTALTVGIQTLVGRITAGNIEALTATQVRTLLNVEDGADVTDSTNVGAAGAVMDSDISAGEGFLRKTGAGAYEGIKSNIGAAVAPTANEDSGDGYAVGSIWLDTTADKSYVLIDSTVAAAVWLETGTTAGLVAHAASHTDGSDDIQDATAGQKGLATATQITKLDGIEALADVTDATNVDSAGAVMEADFNAQTILRATADDTPIALIVGTQTLVGRITAGNIEALTPAQVRTLLNVEDASTGDQTLAEVLGVGFVSGGANIHLTSGDAVDSATAVALLLGDDLATSVQVGAADAPVAMPGWANVGSTTTATLIGDFAAEDIFADGSLNVGPITPTAGDGQIKAGNATTEFFWAASINEMRIGGEALTTIVKGRNAATANTAGAALSIEGGAGTATDAAGGAITVIGGAGAGTGNGGALTISGGAKGATGADGTVSIGTATTSAITIGATGITTSFPGTATATVVDGVGTFETLVLDAANADVFIGRSAAGRLTVGTAAGNALGRVDAATFRAGVSVELLDNDELIYGASFDTRIDWSPQQVTAHNHIYGIRGDGTVNGGGAMVITELSNTTKDHHHAVSSNPSLIVHSGTDVDSDATQYVRLYHDATNAQISVGSGNLVLDTALEFTSGGPTQVSGSATPEAAVTADVGSVFMRTDGGTGTSLYIKESGVGNTGWVAVAAGGVTNLQTAYNGGNTIVTTGGAGFDVSGIEAFSLDSSNVGASNISTSGAASTLTLEALGGTTNQVIVNSAGTGVNAIRLNATAGGIDIDASNTIHVASSSNVYLSGAINSTFIVNAFAQDLSLQAFGGGAQTLLLQSRGTGTNAVRVLADDVAGGIDIDAGTGGIAIDTTGALSFGSVGTSDWTNSTGNLTVSTTTSGTLALTSAGALDLDGTAVTIDGSTTVAITSGTTNAVSIDSGTTGAINIATGTGAKTISIGTGITGAKTVIIGDDTVAGSTVSLKAGATGDITFDANASTAPIPLNTAADPDLDTTAQDIVGAINENTAAISGAATSLQSAYDGGATIAGATALDIDLTGGITIDSTATISIGGDADTGAINLGTAGVRTVSVGSAAATAVNIDAIAVSIDATTSSNLTVTGVSQVLTIAALGGSLNQVIINSVGTGTGAIELNSTVGGIELDGTANSFFQTTGVDNVLTLQAAGSGANSKLRLFGGGTGASAVQINASAGGINIDAATASRFTVTTGDLTLETITSGNMLLQTTTAGNITVDPAAVLNLGNTNATSVVISNAGSTTTFGDKIEFVSGGPTQQSGSATPEAAVTADIGSLFMRTDGGTGTSLYVKESGVGNTGWIAVTAYVHPNHSGDVTSVADGAQTIAVGVVTLAKMADMATASFIGRDTAATGVPEILSKTTALSILNVEDGADVTDATNVNSAGAVMETDYNAQTILRATADDTPTALTVGEQTLVGRITAGNIEALTVTQVRTLLNVEDASTGDQTLAEVLGVGATTGGIAITGEPGSGAAGGIAQIEGGLGASGFAGGAANVYGGAGTGAAVGGNFLAKGGTGGAASTGGSANLFGGNGGATSGNGGITLVAGGGGTGTGNGGSSYIRGGTGAAVGNVIVGDANTGSVSIATGSSTAAVAIGNALAGAVSIIGDTFTAAGAIGVGAAGGVAALVGGVGAATFAGGDAQVYGGAGGTTGIGGNVLVGAGIGGPTDATGGQVNVFGGQGGGTNGAGGLNLFSGGVGVGTGAGGIAYIRGGSGSGAGADGTVRVGDANTARVDIATAGISTVLGDQLEFTVGGPIQVSGSATPEAAITADVGSVFMRTDGGAGTSLYVKESGTGNTGWVAVAAGAGDPDQTLAEVLGVGATTGGIAITGELGVGAGAGGGADLFGGVGGPTDGVGGDVRVLGGAGGGNGAGGTAQLQAGAGVGTGNGGSTYVRGGDSPGGTYGIVVIGDVNTSAVSIAAGTSTADVGIGNALAGNVSIIGDTFAAAGAVGVGAVGGVASMSGGVGASGFAGGAASVIGGNGSGAAGGGTGYLSGGVGGTSSSTGGNTSITGGAGGTPDGAGGWSFVAGGPGTGTGGGGHALMRGGYHASGTYGSVYLGDAYTAAVNIMTGVQVGNVNIGNNLAGTVAITGSTFSAAGANGVGAAGGAASLTGGTGGTAFVGGVASVTGGAGGGTSGAGGRINLWGGAGGSPDGVGGLVLIQGGASPGSGAGGSSYMRGGGGGSSGNVIIGDTTTAGVHIATGTSVSTVTIGNSLAGIISFSDTKITGPRSVLATVTGISGIVNVTPTTLYTVPSGKTCIIEKVILRVTAATAAGGDAVVGVGIASGEADIIAPVELTSFTTVDDAFVLSPGNGLFRIADDGEIIKMGIDTVDSGTAVTWEADVIGYIF